MHYQMAPTHCLKSLPDIVENFLPLLLAVSDEETACAAQQHSGLLFVGTLWNVNTRPLFKDYKTPQYRDDCKHGIMTMYVKKVHKICP